jgi:hypothetical protein
MNNLRDQKMSALPADKKKYYQDMVEQGQTKTDARQADVDPEFAFPSEVDGRVADVSNVKNDEQTPSMSTLKLKPKPILKNKARTQTAKFQALLWTVLQIALGVTASCGGIVVLIGVLAQAGHGEAAVTFAEPATQNPSSSTMNFDMTLTSSGGSDFRDLFVIVPVAAYSTLRFPWKLNLARPNNKKGPLWVSGAGRNLPNPPGPFFPLGNPRAKFFPR